MWIALVIDLPVDRALWQYHSLELGEILRDLHVESVVEDEAGAKSSLGDEGENLCGARMNVGCVQAAWFEPEGSESNAETDKRGEIGTVGENDFTTKTGGTWVGSRIEVKLETSVTVFHSFAQGEHTRRGRGSIEER